MEPAIRLISSWIKRAQLKLNFHQHSISHHMSGLASFSEYYSRVRAVYNLFFIRYCSPAYVCVVVCVARFEQRPSRPRVGSFALGCCNQQPCVRREPDKGVFVNGNLRKVPTGEGWVWKTKTERTSRANSRMLLRESHSSNFNFYI